MHDVLLKLHRWVALAVGIIIFIAAVTGSVLVFEAALDRALNADVMLVTPRATRVPLAAALQAVRTAYPKDTVTGLSLPQAPDQSILVSLKSGLAAGIDPYTGRVLGLRDRSKGAARFIHVLHTSLVAGETGSKIVGTVTLLTFLLAVSGIILWWPRKIFVVKGSRSWRRMNFDLHNVLGFYSAIFLVFITLAGVIIAFEQTTDPLIMKLNASSAAPAPTDLSSKPVAGARPLSLDEAVRIAENELPGARVVNLNVPPAGKAVYRMGMKFPEDRTPGGRSRVAIDQYSGAVLQALSTRTAPLGTRILNLKRSIHTGDVFGWPSRALAVVVCLMLAGQVVSGFFMWWKPGRLAVPARRKSAAPAVAAVTRA